MEGLSDLMEALSDLLKTLNDLLQAPSDLLVSFFLAAAPKGTKSFRIQGESVCPSVHPVCLPLDARSLTQSFRRPEVVSGRPREVKASQ